MKTKKTSSKFPIVLCGDYAANSEMKKLGAVILNSEEEWKTFRGKVEKRLRRKWKDNIFEDEMIAEHDFCFSNGVGGREFETWLAYSIKK